MLLAFLQRGLANSKIFALYFHFYLRIFQFFCFHLLIIAFFVPICSLQAVLRDQENRNGSNAQHAYDRYGQPKAFNKAFHRKTGKIQLLANSDVPLDKDGFITGDPEKIIRHSMMAKKLFAEIVALPIRENGSVGEKPETFFPEDWECFLAPGDNVLSLHIPADGKLDLAECKKSLQRMKEFYHAAGYNFKAFVCSTWFLDASMEKFAGSNSNMVKFQEFGSLIGPATASCDVIYRVFGAKGIEAAASPMSQLQQNLADHFAAGGVFRGGRIIIDPETI